MRYASRRTNRTLAPLLAAVVLSVALLVTARAEAPHVHAITGARIVTAAGSPLEAGTVVVRGGLIEAVGAGVAVPPDATVIDGKGLTVYPGLIDMGSTAGLVMPRATAPADAQTLIEIERARRQTILRPQLEAASYFEPDAPELMRWARAGVTAVLATPPGDLVRGRSSLVTVWIGEEAPQIGNVADERRGRSVLRTPVALHVTFPTREGGSTYPASLLGGIAFVRQAFLDAGHRRVEAARAQRLKLAVERTVHDPALDALQPALDRKLAVAFQAARVIEIRRAMAFAREFTLDPIITGGNEADAVAAELVAQKARVLYSLDYPVRPRTLAPDADEPLRALRERANAPKVPAALDKAGVLFAFQSAGLTDPRDFVRNASRAVKAGLSPDAAIRALTINAATIAGVADRLGSIEKGKTADLIVTDGDLFDEKTKIVHVLVGGRLLPPDTSEPPSGGARRR